MAKREMKSAKAQKVEETSIDTVDTTVEVEQKIIPIGIVTNCSKLNIRKKPGGKVITEVLAKTELTIDPDFVDDEWYKVMTDDSKVGYCMKKYITIK